MAALIIIGVVIAMVALFDLIALTRGDDPRPELPIRRAPNYKMPL